MPHVIMKLWPGKTEKQKQQLADRITEAVMETLHYGDESVSVGFEEVPVKDWKERVYAPDIAAKESTLYKKPGYRM
jgi:4-oxalocrotonate tautomerase